MFQVFYYDDLCKVPKTRWQLLIRNSISSIEIVESNVDIFVTFPTVVHLLCICLHINRCVVYTHTIGNNIVCQRLFIIGIRRRIEDDIVRGLSRKSYRWSNNEKSFPSSFSYSSLSLSCFEPPLFFPVKAYSAYIYPVEIYICC